MLGDGHSRSCQGGHEKNRSSHVRNRRGAAGGLELAASEGTFLGVDSGTCKGDSGGVTGAFFLCDFLAGALLGVSTEVLGDTMEAEETESDAAEAAGATWDAAVTAVRSSFTLESSEGATPLKA